MADGAARPRRSRRAPFEIAGTSIAPGERVELQLPAASLYTHTDLTMPIEVVHGRRDGPVLLVNAAIHGDELNGVEVIRRVLARPDLGRLRGTLVAVPIVNVFGFIHKSRYLPDRRDLNRCFPGSERGSLGGRMAWLFLNEVVKRCSHIIDLHTGAIHRANLPQIRGDLGTPGVEAMARAFGAPVIINAALRDGSLRGEAGELGIPVVTYEAGEALRFDETSIAAGTRGVVRVMRALGMLPASRSRRGTRVAPEPFVARNSSWVRAEQDGIFRPAARLGEWIHKGDVLGVVGAPVGNADLPVVAGFSGVVIGRNNLPLVNEGDALFHVARFEAPAEVAREVEKLEAWGDSGSGTPGNEPPIT